MKNMLLYFGLFATAAASANQTLVDGISMRVPQVRIVSSDHMRPLDDASPVHAVRKVSLKGQINELWEKGGYAGQKVTCTGEGSALVYDVREVKEPIELLDGTPDAFRCDTKLASGKSVTFTVSGVIFLTESEGHSEKVFLAALNASDSNHQDLAEFDDSNGASTEFLSLETMSFNLTRGVANPVQGLGNDKESLFGKIWFLDRN